MFCWQVLQEGKGNVLEQYGRFVVAQYPVLLCLVVLIPFFAWDAIRFSLRVAEPLHRIRTTIQGIESGRKLRTVKLRKGDYLQEVIDDLNSLILHLEERSLVTLDSTLSGSSQSVVERAGIARTSTQDNQGSRAVSHAV
jgi:hypothetical protein